MFDAVPEIITWVLAFFEESVTEVATMVTVPPDGTVAGAVYVVMTVLSVRGGLKLPQADVGVQLQFTPALAESLVTVAATLAVPLGATDAGGIVDNVTDIVVEMATAALMLFEESVTEVAIMVTLPPDGTVAGAV
jgi:glycine cleavage system regulatory protein